MLAGSAEFVSQYPIATKRVLRAMLKAIDLCVSEPKSVARRMVDGGFTERYDYALQTLTEVARTTNGASTTPRTRCGSMRCACTRSA